ncbi:ankyrin repeat domain-containing protein [Mucilaginibacter panaciglaebae]|uniref:Ankyrin repeat protein n=1 Tax=Mucilaginibacter panaciglaebae TaxID=502331 RepID=A0ABP7X175_9SPHI
MAEVFVSDKAKADENARNGELEAVTAFLRRYPGHLHFKAPWYAEAGCDWSKPAAFNAKQIIKHKHWFVSWAEYAAFREQLESDVELQRFEAAVNAICDGDFAFLKRLLNEDAELVQRRSLRGHRATLLNYTGANGIEDWRQKTPANIVDIARLLLETGADTDAWGDMYGGTSTLGLVATSVHPVIAGVQEPLMDILIRHGADPNRAVAPNYTGGMLILACIHNGRYEPVHYLARHGAKVDLEGACALGDLEKVRALFDEAVSQKQNIGLTWACQYGHIPVVDFLLEKGLSVNTAINGTTPLLAAAFEGQLQMVIKLLDWGADIEAVNDYGGTALGQTLWCLYNHRCPDHLQIMELLINRGAIIKDDWQTYINEIRAHG